MSVWCSKHVEAWNKLIAKQILCIKWSITKKKKTSEENVCKFLQTGNESFAEIQNLWTSAPTLLVRLNSVTVGQCSTHRQYSWCGLCGQTVSRISAIPYIRLYYSEVRGSYGDDIAFCCVVGSGISEEPAAFIFRFLQNFPRSEG